MVEAMAEDSAEEWVEVMVEAYWPAYSYPIASPMPYGGGFYQPAVEPKQEMGMLAEEAKVLKEQLEAINKRITELEEAQKK